MLKRARYFRWAILLITLLVEAAAFWFGGPRSAPDATLSQSIILKLGHPMSWTWVGWVSLSMAWLWAELAMSFYTNGRRTRAVLRRSSHEKLVYDTGVHWLVLLRDIHINRLNDGEKSKLEEPVFATGVKRSFAWYAIWLPVFMALMTMLYFVGWAAWSIRSAPESAQVWSSALQSFMEPMSDGPFAFLAGPLEQFVVALPQWLEAYYALARDNALVTLGVIVAAWFLLRMGAGAMRKLPVIPVLFRYSARLAVLAGVFLLLATKWFDWLSPIYNLTPHHGLVAIGFLPLTLASAFYFPHILFWSSWRYAIVRDKETFDATLITLGGVFNSLQQRINLQRIVDTDIQQWWWQRVFDIGDVELKEMGGSDPERIRHIFGPHRMLDEIRNAIRESKKHSGQRSEFPDGELD